MKRFSFFIQVFVVMFIFSACGAPETVPAIDPVELQVTAVAAASTIMAETQAAIPTATTILAPTAVPTDTPAFTPTIPPLPTLGATFTPNPVATSGPADPCIDQVLPDSLTGDKIKIRIDNPTKDTINLSVYLQQARPQAVCGYRAFVLAPQDSLVITDLVVGCYSLWAWNPTPDNYFMVTNGTSCLDTSRNWTFDILPGSIRLRE